MSERAVEYAPILPIGPQPPFFPTDRSHIEPPFNAREHLDLGSPKTCTLTNFDRVHPDSVPVAREREHSQLAFTSAFPVLSASGVQAMRTVIDNHRDLQSSNTRINRYLRGMAYSSKWVRAWAESPEVVAHLSRLAGMPLIPHYFHGSYAHTNLSSDPSANKPVDSWHVDSCPFVLIVVCSNMDGMEGGTLQVVKRQGQKAAVDLVKSTDNNVRGDDMMVAEYVQAGYGIFMQGSDLLHRVTPVTKAREARISVVNSYMPANVFTIDRTAPGSYLGGIDGKTPFPEAAFEYTRGRAWRAMHQLRHYVNQPFTVDRERLAGQLELTVEELQACIDALRGRRRDYLGFIEESSKKGTDAAAQPSGSPAKPEDAKKQAQAATDHEARSGIASSPRLAPSKL
jgi:hypothetical protein